MKRAILRGSLAALLASLCCALVLCAVLFNYRITQQTEQDLLHIAQAAALSLDEEEDKEQFARLLAQQTNLRVTVVAENGDVLADSETDPAALPSHLQREEIQEAAREGWGVSVRSSDTVGCKLMYAAVHTPGGQYIRVATEYSGLWLDLVSFWPVLVAGVAAGLIAAVPLASRQAAAIARPIAWLSRGLSGVTGEKDKVKLDVDSYPYPELQQMARDINQLSEEVSGNMRRLQAEKEKIDYILDNMSEGFLLLDEEERVLTINEAACSFFQCRRADVQGKNLLFATRNLGVLEAVNSVAEGKQDTAQAQLPLAGRRTVQANVSRVREGEGGLAKGAIMILTDITDQKNAVKLRQEFFQSASHELKTPITSIRGFAELLCSDMPLDEGVRKDFSNRILKEAERMTSLIGDIIMISRMESGDITFERETVDLADAVRESADAVRGLAAQGKVELEVRAEDCSISASRREMGELFGNLLVNAVRYNHPGGRVQASLTVEKGRPVFQVFNTGDPIPEKYRERIFERFFRIDKGRSKESGGTGLGLAIVKHIAGSYGASIDLEVTGEGNRFIVRF